VSVAIIRAMGNAAAGGVRERVDGVRAAATATADWQLAAERAAIFLVRAAAAQVIRSAVGRRRFAGRRCVSRDARHHRR
jgi:hypothetical protein